MKPTILHSYAYYLLTGLILLMLSGCEKSDKTTTSKEPEPVIIPQADRLQPAPAIPTVKIPKPPQKAQPTNKFFLRFLATGESFYTEIKLENGIISYTYFEDTHEHCKDWVKSSPCWQQNDLKTISMALPDEDLDNLYAVVKDSGILMLKYDTFGDAKAGQRHYNQHLEIKIDGIKKRLTYKSFPGADKKPEAFAQLETTLLEYARDLPH